MNLVNPYRYSSSSIDPATTNAQMEQIWALVGDSMLGYRLTPSGTTPIPGTVKEYKRSPSSIVNIGADLQYIGLNGSRWPRFGAGLYAATGLKPVFCMNSTVGSKVYDSVNPALNWAVGGNLYPAAKARIDAALVLNGTTKPIFVLQLLENDFEGPELLADVMTAYLSLIARINADYISPTIYINVPHYQILIPSLRYFSLKKLVVDLPLTNSNIHVVYNMATIWVNGYTRDEVHLTDAGDDFLCDSELSYVLSTETDRDVRRILNCNFFNPLTTAERTAWKNFITREKAAGEFDSWYSLQIYRAGSVENACTDMNGYTATRNLGSASWNAVTGFLPNGSSTYVHDYFPMASHPSIDLNDVTTGIIIGAFNTGAGVAACLFGTTSTSHTRLEQNASNQTIFGLNNGATLPVYAAERPQSNTAYWIDRSASNVLNLRKEGVIVQTASTVSTAETSGNKYMGARGAVASTFASMEILASFVKKSSGTDFVRANASLRTLLTELSL